MYNTPFLYDLENEQNEQITFHSFSDNNSLKGSNEDNNNDTIQQITPIKIPGRNNVNLGRNTQTQVQELNHHTYITFQTTRIEETKIKEKTKLGRKRKGSNEIGKHNKYTVDHIVLKIKTHIIKCLMTFINVIFSLKGYEDKILQINAERANNNTIEYNEKLLKMT